MFRKEPFEFDGTGLKFHPEIVVQVCPVFFIFDIAIQNMANDITCVSLEMSVY